MSTEKDISGWTGVSQAGRRIRTITTADVRAYVIAVATCAVALTSTRVSWPLLANTPFILLFSAVFVTSKWGSEGAGLVTLTLAALAAPYIAPPAARPAFQDSALLIFIVGAFVGHRIIASQDRDGRATAALMMIQDITSRRLAEDALRESEEKLRGLFESVPVGLFQASPAGVILAVNPALVSMLGYDSSELLQRLNIAELFAD